MTQDAVPPSVIAEEREDIAANTSDNPTMGDIILARLSRRELMSGMLAVSAASLAVSPTLLLAACGEANDPTPSFKFDELGAGADETHHVAAGYDADVLIRWGDKVTATAPTFDPNAQTPDSQSQQFGYNNDFIGYIPLDGASTHGLLVVNHEYTNPELMFPGVDPTAKKKARYDKITREQVGIEMMAHGGSIIEVRRDKGKWSVVPDSKYARRITAETEMRISGPAAGHEKMQTSADPTGTRSG